MVRGPQVKNRCLTPFGLEVHAHMTSVSIGTYLTLQVKHPMENEGRVKVLHVSDALLIIR
jgi:hypothetical protein